MNSNTSETKSNSDDGTPTSEERVLLIIEDDPGLQSQMRWCFDGMEVKTASDAKTALPLLARHKPKVITLDLGLPPDAGGTSEGFALLREIRASHPNSKVIVVTGREEREPAVQAIAAGAYDYYQKPIDAQTLQFVVDRAFKLAHLETLNEQLRNATPTQMPLPGLIATDQAMLTLCQQVQRVAPTDASVLISGETGTGKEIIAQNIHRLSQRSDGPLVTINCAAIPESLLESELFGHEKGSFTGAHARKIGKVEAAHGGTLFLDEIGDMPLPLQGKILRFLQERTFERIGSTQTQSADVRLVSATHRDLSAMISESTFREDLFFRLSEIELALPPLRDRGGDVLLIAQHILTLNQGDRDLRFSAGALDAMQSWPWTGNIRELENRVRRAAILNDGQSIPADSLQLADQTEAPAESVDKLKDVRAQAETLAIQKALMVTGNNMSETARLLGVSRPTLYNLIEKYDIDTQVTEDG